MLQPVECRKIGNDGLQIRWADGTVCELGAKRLRTECPCATCREKRGDESHASPLLGKKKFLKVLEHTLEEEIRLVRIWGIGNYALGMEWGDGHDSGIYTFELLRKLGTENSPGNQKSVLGS